MSENVEAVETSGPETPDDPPPPGKEQQVMVGGPGEGEDAPKPAAESTQDATKYTITKEDLNAMERRIVDEGIKKIAEEAAIINQPKPEVNSEDSQLAQKIADLMFSDPAEALRLQDERTRNMIKTEQSKEKTKNSYWDKFYEENPVLHRHKRVVQFIMNENYAELKDLPVHDAQKILAEKSLSFVADVAQSTGGKVETMSSAKPEALRASGEPTPTVQKPVEKVVNFCDQVQNLQKKKMGLK